jgi:prepilin signal peptidase PulO-like enzyme (type II secretory pathway)
VTLLWLLTGAVFGTIAAAIVAVLADKQIRATVPTLSASCLDCGADRGPVAWLPLQWPRGGPRCPHCGDSDQAFRRWWELGVGGYFAVALGVAGIDSRLALVAGSLPILLILAVDLKAQAVFLPDCYIAIVVGLFLGLIESPAKAAGAVAGMAIAMVVVAFFLVISRWIFRSLGVRTTPIGLTDVYVAAAVGAIVRADGLLPALVAAVISAAAYSIVVPVMRPASRRRLAAFGPFLCVGGLLALML